MTKIRTYFSTAILNSLPNTILDGTGKGVFVGVISEEEVCDILQMDAGDDIPQSFVGHTSFSEALTLRLGIDVPVNRAQFSWENHEYAICCLVQPSRRLNEGERWTEQEILSFPIKYYQVSCIE